MNVVASMPIVSCIAVMGAFIPSCPATWCTDAIAAEYGNDSKPPRHTSTPHTCTGKLTGGKHHTKDRGIHHVPNRQNAYQSKDLWNLVYKMARLTINTYTGWHCLHVMLAACLFFLYKSACWIYCWFPQPLLLQACTRTTGCWVYTKDLHRQSNWVGWTLLSQWDNPKITCHAILGISCKTMTGWPILLEHREQNQYHRTSRAKQNLHTVCLGGDELLYTHAYAHLTHPFPSKYVDRRCGSMQLVDHHCASSPVQVLESMRGASWSIS